MQISYWVRLLPGTLSENPLWRVHNHKTIAGSHRKLLLEFPTRTLLEIRPGMPSEFSLHIFFTNFLKYFLENPSWFVLKKIPEVFQNVFLCQYKYIQYLSRVFSRDSVENFSKDFSRNSLINFKDSFTKSTNDIMQKLSSSASSRNFTKKYILDNLALFQEFIYECLQNFIQEIFWKYFLSGIPPSILDIFFQFSTDSFEYFSDHNFENFFMHCLRKSCRDSEICPKISSGNPSDIYSKISFFLLKSLRFFLFMLFKKKNSKNKYYRYSPRDSVVNFSKDFTKTSPRNSLVDSISHILRIYFKIFVKKCYRNQKFHWEFILESFYTNTTICNIFQEILSGILMKISPRIHSEILWWVLVILSKNLQKVLTEILFKNCFRNSFHDSSTKFTKNIFLKTFYYCFKNSFTDIFGNVSRKSFGKSSTHSLIIALFLQKFLHRLLKEVLQKFQK